MTDSIGRIGGMFGGNSLMVSGKVKDFIEKNSPKEIVIDMEKVSKIDNVEVHINLTKRRKKIAVKKLRSDQNIVLNPNQGIIILDKGEHFEFHCQYLPLELYLYPSKIDKHGVVFKPWINAGRLEKPESEDQQWFWREAEGKIKEEQVLAGLIAKAMVVKDKKILFPEQIVELPHSNNPWLTDFNPNNELLPVFYFRSEAVKEAVSMIKKLNKFVSKGD